jgi:four helix bundle protein
MFNFEKLEVWQKAIDFADLVYTTTRNFPSDERFGLTNQMRRAAVSISSNIAEGCSRASKTDFARFIEIATGSVFEVASQASIGRRQSFVDDAQFQALYAAAEEQSKMLSVIDKILATDNERLRYHFKHRACGDFDEAREIGLGSARTAFRKIG